MSTPPESLCERLSGPVRRRRVFCGCEQRSYRPLRFFSKPTTIASTLPETEYGSDRFITVSKSSLTDQLHRHYALVCLVDFHLVSLAHTGATRRPFIPAIDLPKNSRRFISMANHSSNNSCHSATLQSNSAAVFRCRQNISGRPIMQENFHPFFPFIAHSSQKFRRGENPSACAMVAQVAQGEP